MIEDKAVNVDPTNPTAILHAVLGIIKSGDLELAEKMLGWGLDFNPNHDGLLHCFAEVKWNTGDSDAAVDWARQALENAPSNINHYVFLGTLLLRLGRLAEAEKVLEQSTQMCADHGSLLRRLSDVKALLGKVDESITLSAQAVALEEGEISGYHHLALQQEKMGLYRHSEATLRVAIEKDPMNVATFRMLSELSLRQGDLESSHHWVRKAIELEPYDPANYNQKATLALAESNHPAAIDALHQAATLEKVDGKFARRLSDLLMRIGEWRESIEWADRAITNYKKDPLNFIHLGSIRMSMGDYDAAEDAFHKALSVSSSLLDRGHVMRKLSALSFRRDDLDGALASARRAISTNGWDVQNHDHLATLLISNGDYDEAEHSLLLGLEINPAHGSLLRRLSDLRFRRGETELALAAASMVVATNPGDPIAHLHQASLFSKCGRTEAAEQALTIAVALAPRNSAALCRLSDVKLQLGQVEDASKLAEFALRVSPHDAGGYRQLALVQIVLGDLQAAEKILADGINRVHPNATLIRQLIDVQVRQRKFEHAKEWVVKELKDTPSDLYLLNQLANLELSTKHIQNAKEALARAAELSTVDPKFHRRLSDILLQNGEEEEAIQWAERMITDFPKKAVGYFQLGKIHLTALRFKDAELIFERALEIAEIGDEIVILMHGLADLAVHQNHLQNALHWASRAAKDVPLDPTTHSYIAAFHLAQGNIHAAEPAARRAVELAPTMPSSLRRMSDLMLRLGRPQEALRWATKSVNVNVFDPHSHFQLATVLLAQGDTKGAGDAVRKAVALDPDNSAFQKRAEYLRIVDDFEQISGRFSTSEPLA